MVNFASNFHLWFLLTSVLVNSNLFFSFFFGIFFNSNEINSFYLNN